MPFPKDEAVMKLSADILQMFDGIFGRHPSFRPAHAKGQLLTGTFTPATTASNISHAKHFVQSSTPLIVRFSNSTGVPVIPDTDNNANPRGIAIRFQFAPHVHTDIVAHSTDGFPTKNGDEFLQFLRALASSDPKAPSDPNHPKPIEVFLHSHPATLAFVQTPKPAPVSFAREQYFGVTAFKFTNDSGESVMGRYRIVPVAGIQHLTDAETATKSPNFLFDELHQRIASTPISFRLQLQLANAEDVTNDSTVHWPADRKVVELGTIKLDAEMPNEASEAQQIIFDPIPRIDGVEPSADPLLELRAAIYLLSGKRRRADPPHAQPAPAKQGIDTNAAPNTAV